MSSYAVGPFHSKSKTSSNAVSVGYLCDCDRSFPIDGALYFCQGCQKLRCIACVTQEIDSFFCPNCLENMPSSEATHYKNSCKKCFECPMCFTALSYQSASATALAVSLTPTSPRMKPNPTPSLVASQDDDKDKVFFLKCGFCQWDSLSIGLKSDSPTSLITLSLDKDKFPSDSNITFGSSAARDSLGRVIEKYQKEERDKAKERRNLSRMKRNSILFMNKNALLSSSSSGGGPNKPAPTKLQDLEKTLEAKNEKLIKKKISTLGDENGNNNNDVTLGGEDDEEELLKELRKDSVDVNQVTTLEQRFTHPSLQPRVTSRLLPSRVSLLSRRTKHCSTCDKLLIKPDLNAAKIEFKRQHVAIFYVPKITVASLPFMQLHEEVSVVLRFANPVHNIMHITMHNDPQTSSSVQIVKSVESTFISPKDHDDEDEDEEITGLKAKDDHAFIMQRKSNWVLVKYVIKAVRSTQLKFCLTVGVKYKGTATSGDQEFNFPVEIHLGSITAWNKEQQQNLIKLKEQQQQAATQVPPPQVSPRPITPGGTTSSRPVTPTGMPVTPTSSSFTPTLSTSTSSSNIAALLSPPSATSRPTTPPTPAPTTTPATSSGVSATQQPVKRVDSSLGTSTPDSTPVKPQTKTPQPVEAAVHPLALGGDSEEDEEY